MAREGGKPNFRDVQLPEYPTAAIPLRQHSRLGARGNFGVEGAVKFHQICILARSSSTWGFFLIPWNYSGFTPLEMTALTGLKLRSQPSPGILPPDREQEPSCIRGSFSLLQRLLPMD